MDDSAVRDRIRRLGSLARALLDRVTADVRRILAPLIAAWSRFAIERWERAQAFFSAHPDMAETDRFLDRWYSLGQA